MKNFDKFMRVTQSNAVHLVYLSSVKFVLMLKKINVRKKEKLVMAKKTNKTKIINVRATEEQKRKIEKNAKKRDMTTSQYLIEGGVEGFGDIDRINGAKALVAFRELMDCLVQEFGHEDMVMAKGEEIWDSIVMK